MSCTQSGKTHNQTSISVRISTYRQIWHPVYFWAALGVSVYLNAMRTLQSQRTPAQPPTLCLVLLNSESPSDISTSIDTGLIDGSHAEPHTLGQEMALMTPLFCSNVASGGEQTKMDLALWEINVVLRVELYGERDTGSQRRTRRYMAKWQLSDGNMLLAEDFWLPGVTDWEDKQTRQESYWNYTFILCVCVFL